MEGMSVVIGQELLDVHGKEVRPLADRLAKGVGVDPKRIGVR